MKTEEGFPKGILGEHPDECPHHETVLIDFDRMWGDGEVVCKNCRKHIRWFDSG